MLARKPEGVTAQTLSDETGKSKEQIRKVVSQSGGRIYAEPIEGSRNRKVYKLVDAAVVDDDDLERWMGKLDVE